MEVAVHLDAAILLSFDLALSYFQEFKFHLQTMFFVLSIWKVCTVTLRSFQYIRLSRVRVMVNRVSVCMARVIRSRIIKVRVSRVRVSVIGSAINRGSVVSYVSLGASV